MEALKSTSAAFKNPNIDKGAVREPGKTEESNSRFYESFFDFF